MTIIYQTKQTLYILEDNEGPKEGPAVLPLSWTALAFGMVSQSF